ncbi:glycoside hydrolase family 35 protein [Tilletiaria anomala UBC 951]|uniref:beta-galactosidase n=1 Tax=Tilletiaria anomala (strain ATCC 24038 / CBS 436.72 / UBC 951) TaxID=1037660 RepID=A0A066VW70_TILAU|nr:glycoside hydrolase family 35 protein [Tilletiaria anomala UBC 951]KDN44533.1 glycoside hydrolase family 35 protein [Tilletiaria anomala UBC 951]
MRSGTGSKLQSKGPLSWDDRSVVIGGQRIMIYAEEYHPYRNPVPGLWRDALQKIKSANFNTVSIYTSWGIISPKKGVAYLESFNDLEEFLKVAKEVGIFVILRPGPYINAETTNGGIAPWLQNEPGIMRQNSTAYTQGQIPYLTAITDIAKKYQLSTRPDGEVDPSSGPIIMVQVENEYSVTPERQAYFDDLKQFYTEHGITVPFSFNTCCTPAGGAYADDVELYGQDGYPLGFDCGNPTNWGNGVQTGLEEEFHKIKSIQPVFLPEYQGGSFDPYGGYGYEQCYQLVGVEFARVWGQSLLAEGVRMQSYYMGLGGTSWAGIAYPHVYTSYDYAAGIKENRIIRDKHREYALTAGFWQAFPEFIGAERVAFGPGTDVVDNDKSVYASKFNATDNSQQTFYVVRQTNSTSTEKTTFKMTLDTVRGQRSAPAEGTFTLNGRDSRLIAVNGALSKLSTLLYSTAQIGFVRSYGGSDVVLLHGDPGVSHEAVFAANDANAKFTVTTYDKGKGQVVSDTTTAGEVRLNWKKASHSISHVALTAGNIRIIAVLADTFAAYETYSPPTTKAGTLSNYAGTGELALISGVYLIRNATISGNTLELFGATTKASTLEVFTTPEVSKISFNGKALESSKTEYGSVKASSPGPTDEALSFQPPKLTGWKYADSLPEISSHFDDKHWTKADHTSSHNEYFQDPVVQTQGKVLFADAYGYHANNIVWRGKFDAMPAKGKSFKETGIYFHFQGGSFSAGSLWLNDKFLGTLNADSSYSDAFGNFTFPAGALKHKDNILTFLHDNTGLEEDGGYPMPIGFRPDQADADSKLNLQTLKMPRGIMGFSLLGSKHTQVSWKVQGNKGGENAPDRVRTYINEGGLYGEVQGWHLPGFDDSKWECSSPQQGIKGAGVAFYRTTFNLNMPTDHDIPISVHFSEDKGTDYRALLYVNGWQFGRRFTRYGPQTAFVIPPGVLNTNGKNTIAISLWNTVDKPTAISSITLGVDGVYTGATDHVSNNPGWKELRG